MYYWTVTNNGNETRVRCGMPLYPGEADADMEIHTCTFATGTAATSPSYISTVLAGDEREARQKAEAAWAERFGYELPPPEPTHWYVSWHTKAGWAVKERSGGALSTQATHHIDGEYTLQAWIEATDAQDARDIARRLWTFEYGLTPDN